MAETDQNIIINNKETNQTKHENDETQNIEIDIKDVTDKLDNNGVKTLLDIIEIAQKRGSIPVKSMIVAGQRYMRILSYLEFSQLNDEEKNATLKKEEENPDSPKFLKQLDIKDLVYGFNFIDRHKKLGTFKNDELDLVNLTFKKIYNTLKPYIKETDGINEQTNTSFNPLETINEEKELAEN